MIPAALPMPDGYAFLSKSDKYMTGLCRKRTRAADKILYIVSEKTVLRGLYAPESVVTEVRRRERETRGKRRANVRDRDAQSQGQLEDVILKLFPRFRRRVSNILHGIQ